MRARGEFVGRDRAAQEIIGSSVARQVTGEKQCLKLRGQKF